MKILSDPAAFKLILSRLDQVEVTSRAHWGVMCAHKMVHHLTDSMRGASSGWALDRFPSPLRHRVGRFMVLRSGIPWPKNVATVPKLDLRHAPQPDASEFARDGQRLRAEFERFYAIDSGALSPEHPYFGPMTRDDWMRWAWLHADHHLRQFGA